MKSFRIPVAALALLLLACGAFAAPGVTLIMPFDGAVVRSPEMLVLYQTPAGFAPKVINDGFKVPEGKLVPGNTDDLHHLSVELKEGSNKLVWVDPSTDKTITELSVYYIPKQSQKRVPVAKAKEFKFHQVVFEKKCDECHPMPEEMETVPGKPMSPAGKVCSSCHPTVDKSKTQHEPTAIYDCFRCHQTVYKPSRFTIRSSQSALCGDCHRNFFERILGSNKFVHGPAASGYCDTCHDPHGGEGKGILREPVQALCLRCHAETVQPEIKNSIHNTLECTKCHNAHGADNADFTHKPKPDLCLNCHEDPMKKYNGHPLQGHPVAAPVDPSKPGRAMGCASCHAIHGKPDVSKLNILENDQEQRKFCMRCHY